MTSTTHTISYRLIHKKFRSFFELQQPRIALQNRVSAGGAGERLSKITFKSENKYPYHLLHIS